MVIVVGELTSYRLCGFLQTFILTRPVKIVLETADTIGCNLLGKKLKKSLLSVLHKLRRTINILQTPKNVCCNHGTLKFTQRGHSINESVQKVQIYATANSAEPDQTVSLGEFLIFVRRVHAKT